MDSFSLELICLLPFGKCAIFQKLPATNPPPQPTITKSEDPLALEAPLFFIAIAGGASTVPRSERDHTTLAEYINR